MKLVNPDLLLNMELEEGRVSVLTIEKPAMFTAMLWELKNQIDGEEGNFVLSESGKELPLVKNMDFVVDVISFSFSEKRIVNKLYSTLAENAYDYFEEKEQINTQIVNLLDKVLSTVALDDLVINDSLDWHALMKLYAVRLPEEYESLLAKLCNYIKVCSMLCSYRLVAFTNLKSYLEEEELLTLYRMASYYKIQLLLIEPEERKHLPEEKQYIIDRDCCVIISE